MIVTKHLGWKLIGLSVGATFIGKKWLDYLKEKDRFKQLIVKPVEVEAIPTIMLHGTFGKRRSLGGMIARFEAQHLAKKVLDVWVSEQGEISVLGAWDNVLAKQNPIIQVTFENANATELQQALWLKQVVEELARHIHITKLNFVGHSMGGVAIMRYFVEAGNGLDIPITNKFVAIGAPFNGELVHATGRTIYDLGSNGPKHFFKTYRYIHAFKQRIPKNLKILNVYGDLKNRSRSDGLVSIDSARSLGFLVKDRVKQYEEYRVSGWMAQHSLLHENKEVDQLVAHYLWS